MMQPTPAPSVAPSSPRTSVTAVEPQAENTYPPPPPSNAAEEVPFSALVALFEKLSVERKHDRRRRRLECWLSHWRTKAGHDLYPVLRLLLPQKDRERATYGLKEKNLAKTYIKLIPLGPRDPDAIRMLNWKKPSDRDKTSGDFPQVLCEVVSKRSSVVEGTLTINEVNEVLDDLARNQGKSDVQSKILRKIYNNTTADEQRWIVRIILKDMNISVKETTVFSVFHPDAQDLYNTCSDLKKVAWELWDLSYRLNAEDKTVRMFQAFAPMLCKRPTKKLEETVKEMDGTEFIIEEKLDGERMQLHKRGNQYFYCSRKGKDYTYLYGAHVGTGSLTPYIDSAFDPRIREIILDGEMLVWDPVSERNLPFGTLKTAAMAKSKESSPRPCFKIFDLLYLNGQSLLNRSTAFRKKNMKACVKPISGRIELATEWKGKTARDIRERMEQVMEDRGEGLVIKHPHSQYQLNGRTSEWMKVKPEYMDNMGETVDVLVVAANYGTGRRGGGVSTLICAVMDDRRPDTEEEPKYSSFVRIGSGLTFADYMWIRSKPWKIWDPKHPPEFLQTAKRGQEDKGDVYLDPEDSFILKVKAAEITPSDQYHMGYTMRFPRALSIRDDLSIADCMTASEVFESLRSEKKRKMDDNVGVATKKRKTTAAKMDVVPALRGPSLKKREVKSDLFNGMTFVVMSDPKSRTGETDKRKLVNTIHANGGEIAQIAAKRPGAYVVYGGTTTPYDLKLVIDKGTHDVVTPAWITDSIDVGAPVPLRKKYFFFATEERKDTDSYKEGIDGDEGMEDVREGPSGEVPSTPAHPPDDSETEKEEDAPDSEFAEWLAIRVDKTRPAVKEDDDSATDPDSDVADEEIEPELDDWVEVSEPAKAREDAMGNEHGDQDVKMGETDDAMQYDPDAIFKHLCFYLDSPSQAQRNGMSTRTKYEKEINQSFDELAKVISDNGGRIVELDDPKLTHVVLDKRDLSRRVELMKRTAKPRRRHLITSDFIQVCLDEETLLDEEDFVA